MYNKARYLLLALLIASLFSSLRVSYAENSEKTWYNNNTVTGSLYNMSESLFETSTASDINMANANTYYELYRCGILLTGIDHLESDSWFNYVRAKTSSGTHTITLSMDIIIYYNNGSTIRQTLMSKTGEYAQSLSTTYVCWNGTISFSGYTVISQTDRLAFVWYVKSGDTGFHIYSFKNTISYAGSANTRIESVNIDTDIDISWHLSDTWFFIPTGKSFYSQTYFFLPSGKEWFSQSFFIDLVSKSWNSQSFFIDLAGKSWSFVENWFIEPVSKEWSFLENQFIELVSKSWFFSENWFVELLSKEWFSSSNLIQELLARLWYNVFLENYYLYVDAIPDFTIYLLLFIGFLLACLVGLKYGKR